MTKHEEYAVLELVPPDDLRNRMRYTRGKLGKIALAYIGDAVWEFIVLKHQYNQVARSPMTESQAARTLKQAKAAQLLFRGESVLEKLDKEVLRWGISNSWRKHVKSKQYTLEQVGFEQYGAACGMRTLLGYLYIDAKGTDKVLEDVAREVGLLASVGEEDRLLSEITDGMYTSSPRPTTFFLALAPLGHVALRLYISRYLCERPQRDDEFLYRIQMALRQEELELAAVGFMRDDATAEEIALMRAARDQQDTYAFAFLCLIGHLVLNKPYRLHQIVADFGWAQPVPGT